MRKAIADCSRVVGERARADPRRLVERAAVRDRADAGRGHDPPGGASRSPSAEIGCCAPTPARLPRAARATRRTASCVAAWSPRVGDRAGVGPARLRGGRRRPHRVRAGRRARATSRAGRPRCRPTRARSSRSTSPASATSKMLLCAPEDLRSRASARRRAVAAARRRRVRPRRGRDACSSTPVERRAGAARRCDRRVPVPRRDRQRRLVVAGRIDAPATSRRARSRACRSSCFARENPDSGAPGRWRGGNSLVCRVDARTRSRSPRAQMYWADPSANPVVGLAGGMLGHGRQLPAARQRPRSAS